MPTTKKLKSIDPDVVVIVGGKKFLEYSQALCSWSNYFDTALGSGMKESDSKRFEFPDRDPKEWEWIVALMAPMAKEKVSSSNVLTALSWFDELSSLSGMDECDRVLSSMTSEMDEDDLNEIIENLQTSINYGLAESKSICLKTIQSFLGRDSTILPVIFSKEQLKTIIVTAKNDENSLQKLMPSFGTFLPESVSEIQMNIMIEGEILHELIYLEMRRKFAEDEKKAVIDFIGAYNLKNKMKFSINPLLRKIARDDW